MADPEEAPTAADTHQLLNGQTPVMAEPDLQSSRELSLQSLRPPLRLPGYEQEQFLGRGAFGEVWKAVDSNSGRTVAIKFFSRRGGLDWSYMTREVEKLQHLFSDRHVVQLFHVGWEADPPYYVMEYIGSGSLEDRLEQGPLTVADAVKLIREISHGLVHAHDKGILHCDLKPANIMLDPDGTPRLADFGQARMRHERVPSLGTMFYMAPEQADLNAVPDARWDVYALGVILYRMITGDLPYLNDDTAKNISAPGSIEDRLNRYRELLKTAPRPEAHHRHPDVDESLAEIIDHCLAIDPSKRAPNVQSVLHALALRDTRRAQAPLLVLGLAGPVLVAVVLAVVGGILFRQTMATAQLHLLQRTRESNEFAASSVAARFALEVDQRWRILEQEAENERLRRELASSSEGTAADWEPIQYWLERRHEYWNRHFSRRTQASYWFIVDRTGIIRAISPLHPGLVGKYFGYREYFHGRNHELSPDAPVPLPIAAPHRSNVFRSQPSNRPSVAFSVPIRGDSDASAPVRGVLAMESELGHFAEFHGTRHQFAVLADLRPDETGRSGLIVEHPHLQRQLEQGKSLTPDYLDSNVIDRLNAVRRRDAQELHPEREGDLDAPSPAAAKLTDYVDPCGGEFAGEWLASTEPVFVARGTDVSDTGWIVLIQERRSQALKPLSRMLFLVFFGGLAALALVVVIIGLLWWIVVFSPRTLRRFRIFRRLVPRSFSVSSMPSSESLPLPAEAAGEPAAVARPSTLGSEFRETEPASLQTPSKES